MYLIDSKKKKIVFSDHNKTTAQLKSLVKSLLEPLISTVEDEIPKTKLNCTRGTKAKPLKGEIFSTPYSPS